MKQKRLISAFFILIVFVLSCRKLPDSSLNDQTGANSNQFLKQAKDYFYAQHPLVVSEKQTQSQNSSAVNEKFLPFWQKSYNSKTSQMEFVEVPFVKPSLTVNLYNFNNETGDQKSKLIRVNSSLHRLLIYKSVGGEFHQLVLTYIPNYEYLEKNHYDASQAQINKFKNFTGYIEYATISGDVKFVLYVKDGKALRKYRYHDKTSSGDGNKKTQSVPENNYKTNAYYEVCIEEWQQGCYWAGDPPEEHCQEPIKTGETCYFEWEDDPVPPGDGGGCNYMCGEDPIDGPSGGGGGSGGSLDPCGQGKDLANNGTFKTKMTDLKSKTSLSKEVGYLRDNGTGLYSYIEGRAGEASISINPSNPIDTYIHTHYTGTFPTFSGSDIRAIYQLQQVGKIANIATFTAGVVTANGTTYLMKINDVTKFLDFADSHLKNDSDFQNLESSYATDRAAYSLAGKDNVTSYELALLGALSNSGITLLKGNSTFTSWNTITKTSGNIMTDHIVTTLCN